MYIDGKRTFISLSKYEEYGIPELEQTNKWSKTRREAYERRKQNEK